MTELISTARTDMARYLNGDRTVPRADDYGTPAFVLRLRDDLAAVPQPAPWPVPPSYQNNLINGVAEVPFGTYAWWVRRLEKTVRSVTR